MKGRENSQPDGHKPEKEEKWETNFAFKKQTKGHLRRDDVRDGKYHKEYCRESNEKISFVLKVFLPNVSSGDHKIAGPAPLIDPGRIAHARSFLGRL
jgi:hypothetical protein